MKRSLTILLIVVFVIPLSAQVKSHEQDVTEVLVKLFESGKNKDYKTAAQYIAYSGKDKKRDNIDRYNITNKLELNQVKRICLQIFALLDMSDYKIGKYKAAFDKGVTHYNLQVHFTSGKQEIVKEFRFIRNPDNEYLLDEID